MVNNSDKLLTQKEVGEVLRIARRTLHDIRKNRQIGFVKVGGKILIPQSEVQNYLNKRKVSATA